MSLAASLSLLPVTAEGERGRDDREKTKEPLLNLHDVISPIRSLFPKKQILFCSVLSLGPCKTKKKKSFWD